jgi:hypothetical protein
MTEDAVHIAVYPSEPNYSSLDADEDQAIMNYDYEKARFIVDSREQIRNTNVEDATRHYDQELVEYNRKISDILAKKKAINQTTHDAEIAWAKSRLRQQIVELAEVQKKELCALETRWREAREYERGQVAQTVVRLLSSSRLLAKSHRFEEAISMRDRARSTEKRVRHASLDEVDAGYSEQFEQLLVRYKQSFQELIDQHNAYKRLLVQKRKLADQTAESEDDVEAAYAPVEIMDAALCDGKNPDVAVTVLQHFSPRWRPVTPLQERRTARKQTK